LPAERRVAPLGGNPYHDACARISTYSMHTRSSDRVLADSIGRMAVAKHLSRAAFERLSEEHQDLTTRWRIEIARKIEVAREMGDLSENGDYHAAKEEQGKTEGRIRHLANLIENAVIVDDVPTDHVSAGCVVGIRYAGDDEIEKYLVGSIEERREGLDVMSPGSPLGAALLGTKVGDTVSYEVHGNTLRVEVVLIES
jgi:transcription elongation factor GreA